MRISDWSSDVCSSDLGLGALRRAQQRLRLLGDAGAVADEVELAHQLPAPGAVLPAHSRVAAALGLAVADGGGVDHRPALDQALRDAAALARHRSEEHTSELQSIMRISYAVFCLKTKKHKR